MELLLSGRTMVFVGHERCSCGLGCSGCAMRWLSGIGGEMVLPMVVLCTRLLTTEFDNGIVIKWADYGYGISRMESIKWADYGFAGHERCSCGLGCSGCAMRWLSGRG